MSKQGFDPSSVAAVVALALSIGIAGFSSMYVAGQAGRYMGQSVDAAMEAPSRRSTWVTLRDGYVLGRAESKQGGAAYVVVARRPGGEYRVALGVDHDGSVIETASLGASNGFAYARRLETLFGKTGKRGVDNDDSPLDAAIQPLVIHAIESIARLERLRTEEKNAE